MHMAFAYLDRVVGDRADNLDHGVELLRGAVDELTESSPPETWAIVRTNLATALLRRERGDRRENLMEAADLCRSALQYRSPERDATDWAYTQLNLGSILQDLAEMDKTKSDGAIEAYESVIAQGARIDQKWLVGSAQYSLGRLYRRAASPDVESLVDAEDDELDVMLDTRAELEMAREHLASALELAHEAPDPLHRGRVLHELARVLADLDEEDEAIDAARQGLRIFRPTSDPRECALLAGLLGNLLAFRGEWNEAAAVFRDGVVAANASFYGRLDTDSRESEIRRVGNLHRFAAYAIARAGDALGAVLTLESGRTRELRRRFGSVVADDQLLRLPNDLRSAYSSALDKLVATPLGNDSASSARHLQEVLAVIRSTPGFEDFDTTARPEDLIAAVEPGWPLIYVNPAPYGTVLLRAYLGDGGVVVDAVFLDEPSSLEVFMRLMAGDAAEAPDLLDEDQAASYLAGIAAVSDKDIRDELEQALPWIGEHLAKPVGDALLRVEASGATLIACGPLSLAPLHAAPWRDRHRTCCLLDSFDIRYSPSALVTGVSLKRGDGVPNEGRLVALGNPTNDLRAAGPEIEEIAKHFADDNVFAAIGREASSTFLLNHAHDATFLHLACHAGSNFFDPNDAGVLLSDRAVSPVQFTALLLNSRLTVFSACQTAISDIAQLPDEAVSIGTSALAAGSACAIATLWPVNDGATALIMVRLYEEVIDNALRPPEALRQAQLWLRDLTEEEEQTFLTAHPGLRAEFQRRLDEGDDVPGHRGAGMAFKGESDRPYSHPHFWAPFIAIGA
jgi:CHAT domain-containing protein/tetratricopeptide (TPR) repeat protein